MPGCQSKIKKINCNYFNYCVPQSSGMLILLKHISKGTKTNILLRLYNVIIIFSLFVLTINMSRKFAYK